MRQSLNKDYCNTAKEYFKLWAKVPGTVQECFDWEGKLCIVYINMGMWMKKEFQARNACGKVQPELPEAGWKENVFLPMCLTHKPEQLLWPFAELSILKAEKEFGSKRQAGSLLAAVAMATRAEMEGGLRHIDINVKIKTKNVSAFSPFWMPCIF